MPIIYVHGVATCDDLPLEPRFGEVLWPQVEGHLRDHVAPVLAEDAENVPILRTYWGDLAADFAWDGLFRVSSEPAKAALPERLAPLTPEELGGLLEKVLLRATPETTLWTDLVDITWAVARDADTAAQLGACETLEAETRVLQRAVEAKFKDRSKQLGTGKWAE